MFFRDIHVLLGTRIGDPTNVFILYVCNYRCSRHAQISLPLLQWNITRIASGFYADNGH